MDRIVKAATKRRLDEPDTSWIDYWRTRPVAERLAMATELNQECVGGDPQQGLHRVQIMLDPPNEGHRRISGSRFESCPEGTLIVETTTYPQVSVY